MKYLFTNDLFFNDRFISPLVVTRPTKQEVPGSNPGQGIHLCDEHDICSWVMDVFYVFMYLFIYISMLIVV
jgi:hypothetical protein